MGGNCRGSGPNGGLLRSRSAPSHGRGLLVRGPSSGLTSRPSAAFAVDPFALSATVQNKGAAVCELKSLRDMISSAPADNAFKITNLFGGDGCGPRLDTPPPPPSLPLLHFLFPWILLRLWLQENPPPPASEPTKKFVYLKSASNFRPL